MPVHRNNYLVRHGRGFKFKMHIPADLRPLFPGRKAWTKYIGIHSQPEAELKTRQLGIEHTRLIAQLRKLTAKEKAAIIERGGWNAYRTAVGSMSQAIYFVQRVADLDVEEDDADGALVVLQATKSAKRLREEAAEGTTIVDKVANGKLPGPRGPSLDTLITSWTAVREPESPRSVDKMRLVLGQFKKFVGDIPPKSVTRANVLAFRDHLETVPTIRNVTREKYLRGLNTLFRNALSEGIVDLNPVDGVRVRKASKAAEPPTQRKKPFQPAQVRLILDKMAATETEDFQWIMRLLVYHGARSGEICQLEVADVTASMGIPILRLHAETEGRHLKTAQSALDIPIHPECMGIIEYARAAKGPLLFASLSEKWTERASKFQKRSSFYLRKIVGITDPALTTHSLRHTWRTVAREIDMPQDVSRAILGHRRGSDDHADYGDGVSLQKMATWIARVDPLRDRHCG